MLIHWHIVGPQIFQDESYSCQKDQPHGIGLISPHPETGGSLELEFSDVQLCLWKETPVKMMDTSAQVHFPS